MGYNLSKMENDSLIAKRVEALIKNNENYFKDFDKHTIVDRAIFIETFTYMCKAGIAGFVANKDVDASKIEEMLGKVYDKSILTSEKDIMKLLKNYKAKDAKKILKDPAVALYRSAVNNLYSTADRQEYKELKNEINRLYRLYVKGMMEMDANNVSFPAAPQHLGNLFRFCQHPRRYHSAWRGGTRGQILASRRFARP